MSAIFLGFLSIFFVSAEGIVFKVNISAPSFCYNGIDDDGDSLTDYPSDPDCTTQDDQSEHHLTATCTPSVTSIQLGQSVTWTANPSGGSTTYTYLWSGSELTSTASTVSVTYSTLGSQSASVTVTSGVDSVTVNCAESVVVTSSSSSESSSGGSGGGGGSGYVGYYNSTTESPHTPAQTPVPETDVPEQLNAAPEPTVNTIPQKIIPPKVPPVPRVKLKTQVRLTLREDRGISLTNEPVPVPPRADNLPLFDVISELSGISMNVVNGGLLGKVAPGELLPVSVKLLNVSGTRRLDVQVYYSVLSHENESIYSSSETVAVETTASYVKMVQIPYYIIPGVYNVRVTIKYDGQTVPATSHFPFTVEKKIGGIFQTTLLTYVALALLSALVLAIALVIFRKKYHNRSRLSPIEYSDVPNNMRTFYEIISDTIMDMRQRVGDQAIVIANRIEGLKIDPESGKVLSVSTNPSKIIAELVAEYERELGKKVSFLFRNGSKK